MQSLPPDFHKYNIIFNALLFYVQYYISYNIICQPIKPVTGSLLRMPGKKKECALAHSRACGGRLRHLPYTPQCASSRSVFYFTGKQFPVKQKKSLASFFSNNQDSFSLISTFVSCFLF